MGSILSTVYMVRDLRDSAIEFDESKKQLAYNPEYKALAYNYNGEQNKQQLYGNLGEFQTAPCYTDYSRDEMRDQQIIDPESFQKNTSRRNSYRSKKRISMVRDKAVEHDEREKQSTYSHEHEVPYNYNEQTKQPLYGNLCKFQMAPDDYGRDETRGQQLYQKIDPNSLKKNTARRNSCQSKNRTNMVRDKAIEFDESKKQLTYYPKYKVPANNYNEETKQELYVNLGKFQTAPDHTDYGRDEKRNQPPYQKINPDSFQKNAAKRNSYRSKSRTSTNGYQHNEIYRSKKWARSLFVATQSSF